MTLAAYAIPVSMAYASLAGVPPEHGIYCYLLGGLCYAAFGTSRQLAIGPTSAIALLVGATVAGMADGDPARRGEIAALTALVVAVLSVLAWLLRLSALVSFISETVLVGFKAGAALTIAMTQLPKLFGVKGGGDHFFERAWTLAGQLGETNLIVLAIGLAALTLLALGDKFLPGRPMALFVVALLVGVLLLGILKGVLFAAIASLLMPLAGAARPHVTFLGRIPGSQRFSDLERHPDNEVLPGIVVFRPESSLLYFNADHVRQIVWTRTQETPRLRLVICDLSDSPFLDVAGANVLAGMHADFAKREVSLRILERHGKVRDLLRAMELEERVGYLGRHISVDQAIAESQRDEISPGASS